MNTKKVARSIGKNYFKFIPAKFALYALITFISATASAQSFESVLTSVFKNSKGQSVVPRDLNLSQGTNQTKGYLILFWAGWCVPCKEELTLVTRHQSELTNWEVIAMNVDDAGGRTRADGILHSLNWPFHDLNDESGTLFYQINSSGELPLALAFDPEGHLIEVIRELGNIKLEQLAKFEHAKSMQKGWEITEELHLVHRDLGTTNSELIANTLGVKFASADWQVGTTQNLIRQKRNSTTGWTRFEDELGPTYLQWQNSSTNSHYRARLGDDSVEWGKGTLLSARAIPGTDINTSLLGAHWSQSQNGSSLTLAAGRIRQQLFGLLLDPTIDLTRDLPTESVYGGVFSHTLKLTDQLEGKISVGGLSYHRQSLPAVSTSYLQPYEDSRAHLNVALTHNNWGLDLAQTRYFIAKTQTQNIKQSDTFQADTYWRGSDAGHLQIGATYLEKHDVIPRTFTPVLSDYPATPLNLDDMRTWRLAPRAQLGPWTLEPQWIHEQSIHADSFEKQNSYVISVLRPAMEFKSILLHQRHGSNPLQTDADQNAAIVASALSEILSGQLEYKSYSAKGRAGNTALDQTGESKAAQLTVKIEKLVKNSNIGRLQLSITRTHQDGYYLATSGINRRELIGYRLGWTIGPLDVRVAACQEPGGLVCSGGVCAQRPPLNGFALDGAMHWNF